MERTVKRTDTVLYIGMLILAALLPFHAFLRTWFAALFTTSTVDHLSRGAQIIAAWKEMVLVVLIAIVAIRTIVRKKLPFKVTMVDWLIGSLLLLSTVLFFVTKLPSIQFLFGLRTDFSFFALYFVVRSIEWSSARMKKLILALFVSGIAVIAFGLLLKFILPKDFLLSFGYSPYVGSYVDYKPLPMYHCEDYSSVLGGSCVPRLASTSSGPNQYGTYLMILLSLGIGALLYARKTKIEPLETVWKIISSRAFQVLFIVTTLLSLWYTHSQAALIGTIVMSAAFVFALVKNARVFLCDAGIAFIICFTVLLFFQPWKYLNTIHNPSTNAHIDRFIYGLVTVARHPMGLGVGGAGPVSERFFGDQQGIISESWYLQMSEELGVIGGILFVIITVLFLFYCWKTFRTAVDPLPKIISLAAFLALIGISVDAIVLHAWEDTTTAWLVFMLVGISMQLLHDRPQTTSILRSKGVAAFSGKMQNARYLNAKEIAGAKI